MQQLLQQALRGLRCQCAGPKEKRRYSNVSTRSDLETNYEHDRGVHSTRKRIQESVVAEKNFFGSELEWG
jgi:hypothetical protein